MRTFVASLVLVASWSLHAQPVIVTTELATNRIPAGGSTTLRVFAQIAPAHRDTSARIFSWNVDALAGGALAGFEVAGLQRPLTDNDLETSSPGIVDEPNIRGIRDSFLNVTNAGRNAPIELFSVPVRGLAAGRAAISIQAGSFPEEPDFVIEPIGDTPTLTGADYSLATVALEIFAPLTNLVARLSRATLPENQGELLTISFAVATGYDYFVDSATNLLAGEWTPLPKPPHNIGYADDTNSAPRRFYRVRAMESAVR